MQHMTKHAVLIYLAETVRRGNTEYKDLAAMARETLAMPDDAPAPSRLSAEAPTLLKQAIDLLERTTYQDGHGTVLTEDAEALLGTIDRIINGTEASE